MINGNTEGFKKAHLQQLESLIGQKSVSFCDEEILSVVSTISAKYNREIMVNLARGGEVLDLTVGSHAAVTGAYVSSREGRLSGVRNLHTHPKSAVAQLSQMDLSCLTQTRSDAMAVLALDSDGKIVDTLIAYFAPEGIEQVKTADLSDPVHIKRIAETDARWKSVRATSVAVAKDGERVILVGVCATEESMSELADLVETAGATPVAVLTQQIKPNAATLIGSGKVSELKQAVQLYHATTVVFDNALSGSQAVRLEGLLGVKVLDRFNLILDIFALRALSREGQLQVELAQLKYNLPRLIGSNGSMDKMRSGMGMRGPGEKKLETDRRKIRNEITKLERSIAQLDKERSLRRTRRKSAAIPQVCLVGYTNAGKSTLMRALTKSDVYIADQLFATLDPLTRKVGNRYLLTDTVGFVSGLPHEFMDAFSSTLEEARLADLLLVVLDLSDAERESKRAVVEDTLVKIGAGDNPRLYVYNKADKVLDPWFGQEKDCVTISAATGEGMDALRLEIDVRLGLSERTTETE